MKVGDGMVKRIGCIFTLYGFSDGWEWVSIFNGFAFFIRIIWGGLFSIFLLIIC